MVKKVGTTVNPKPVIPERPLVTIEVRREQKLDEVLSEFQKALTDPKLAVIAKRRTKAFSYLELDVTLHATRTTYRIWAR